MSKSPGDGTPVLLENSGPGPAYANRGEMAITLGLGVPREPRGADFLIGGSPRKKKGEEKVGGEPGAREQFWGDRSFSSGSDRAARKEEGA